jgi:hypothetical protein
LRDIRADVHRERIIVDAFSAALAQQQQQQDYPIIPIADYDDDDDDVRLEHELEQLLISDDDDDDHHLNSNRPDDDDHEQHHQTIGKSSIETLATGPYRTVIAIDSDHCNDVDENKCRDHYYPNQHPYIDAEHSDTFYPKVCRQPFDDDDDIMQSTYL